MSEQEIVSEAGSPCDDDIPLTRITFKNPKDLEGLSAAQRLDLVKLDTTLDPIVNKLVALKGGESKEKSRYILQAKKYLIKYHPRITIFEAADHPVIFGIAYSSFGFSPIILNSQDL